MKVSVVVFLTLYWSCIQASWFPEMEVSAPQWNSIMAKYDLTSYKTCTTVSSRNPGGHIFLPLYKDKPTTLILSGTGSGRIEAKFKDSVYAFNQDVELDREHPCFVIPPYQPIEWLMLNFGQSINVCSLQETTEIKHDASSYNCECAQVINSASRCRALKLPRTIRKPEQEFFLTADITPAANDVTICTILTVDRLLRLAQMSQFWNGPISAAVYLHELNEVSQVLEWWLSTNTMRMHVDIHLVYDDKIIAFELPDRAFPVNILRNVAIRFARTSNVFYIEGDFIPSPDLYPSLDTVKERLATEKAVFIVAPFSADKADFDMKKFPQNKQALREMVTAPNPQIKDLSYFNSHSAFNFGEWFKATSIYTTHYVGGYEPYYIGPKSYPLFEEIFIGCGADKVSHPTELSSAGYSFYVLATGFIIHIDSTGMGSAWCRGWAGNERSTLKWEAFSVKTTNIYGDKKGGSYDSRLPWWDRAPLLALPAPPPKEETCSIPEPTAAPKECPPCKECTQIPEGGADCSPPSLEECKRFTEGYISELEHVKASLKLVEEVKNKYQETIQSLQEDNARLEEYSRFVVNVSIGGIVVMVVVMGVGACVWPRGRKVWALPTWKSTHHSL